MDFDFTLSESLLFTLSSMPSALDWAFPMSLFLSIFWLLNSLVASNELLAWQTIGVGLSKIGSFLFLCAFLFSISFFSLNDFAGRGAYYLRKKILESWQNRVPAFWFESNQARIIGNMALFSFDFEEGKQVYLIERIRERRRDYLLMKGSPDFGETGFALTNVFLFSPAIVDFEFYYKGKIDSVSLNLQGAGSAFVSIFPEYSFSFIELAEKLYFSREKNFTVLKRIRLLWYQKVVALVSSLMLALWAWFLTVDRARRYGQAYPFWMGLIGVGIYLILLVFSRFLVIWFWKQDYLWYLWIPVYFLLVWILVLWLKERIYVALC